MNEKQQLSVPLDHFTISVLESLISNYVSAGLGITLSSSTGHLVITASSNLEVTGSVNNPTLTSIPINSSNTPMALGFQTKVFANGITWNGTTMKFVCTTAGYYQIYLQVGFVMPAGSFSGAANYTSLIYVNSSEVCRASQIPGAGLPSIHPSTSCLVHLSVNDTVSFYAMEDHPQAVDITSGTNETFAFIKS